MQLMIEKVTDLTSSTLYIALLLLTCSFGCVQTWLPS
jgi:hypothetical protein